MAEDSMMFPGLEHDPKFPLVHFWRIGECPIKIVDEKDVDLVERVE